MARTALPRVGWKSTVAVLVAAATITLIVVVGPARASAACPNEALRIGPSALLGECRAYEMVSPPEKSGGGAYLFSSLQSAADGESIEFRSTAAFAGAPANTVNTYIARREAGDWQTSGIDAAQTNPNLFVEQTSLQTDPGFDKTFQYSLRALAPGAIEGGSNLYIRDNSTGVRSLVAAEPGTALLVSASSGGTSYVGATPDWSRFFFKSPRVLAPGAVEGEANNYELRDGQLTVLTLPGEAGEPPQLANFVAVSEDGRRLFLQNPSTQAIYLDEEGAPAVGVSVSHRSGEEGVPAVVGASVLSGNGQDLYFISFAPLTEDTPATFSGRLYRYEVRVEGGQKTETLVDLTPSESPEVQKILGVGRDGTRGYLIADGALPNSNPPPEGAGDLFGWHDSDLTPIAQTDPETSEGGGPAEYQASPNGLYLAIGSYSALTDEDVKSPSCPAVPSANLPAEDCRDVYLYEAATSDLTCISCDPGNPSSGSSEIGLQKGFSLAKYIPRAVLDDGQVFIGTPNALVRRDVNGVGDVYSWSGGKAELVSTGTASSEATFADASADGSDVFFRTNQPLVGQDVDSQVDVYDARVNGGIASQNPPPPRPPCEGQDCRDPFPAPSAIPGIEVGTDGRDCGALLRSAGRLRKRAKALGRRASATSGHRARRVRNRQQATKRKAGKVQRNADQCRRAGA